MVGSIILALLLSGWFSVGFWYEGVETSDSGVSRIGRKGIRTTAPWEALQSIRVTESSSHSVAFDIKASRYVVAREPRRRRFTPPEKPSYLGLWAISRADASLLVEDVRRRRPDLSGLGVAAWSSGQRIQFATGRRRAADVLEETGSRRLGDEARRTLLGGAFLLFVMVASGLLAWWLDPDWSLLAMLCGIGLYPVIRRYLLIRRLQRLATTTLPTTPMMMRRWHVAPPPYIAGDLPVLPDVLGEVFARSNWAGLWHPDALGSPPALYVKLLGRTQDSPATEHVEVLGVPDQGEWVLIRTAEGILWPRRRATASYSVAGMTPRWVERLIGHN